MMAAYNPNKRINFSKTYKQLALNAETVGDNVYVDNKRKKESEYRYERLIKQSVEQAVAIHEASNGRIDLFLDSTITEIDGLTGKLKDNGKLDKYGHPGKRLSQSKFLGVNQVKLRRDEVTKFMLFWQLTKQTGDAPIKCRNGKRKKIPTLKGFVNPELRYIVETGGSILPVYRIPERMRKLRVLLKVIIEKLEEAEFKVELLKWTLEVTFREIDGVYYAHPHLNIIMATEHLTDKQERLFKATLYDAVSNEEDVEVGKGNYIRDCGKIENVEACFRYITKPYHPYDEDKKGVLGEHDNVSGFSGARRYGEYHAHQKTMENSIPVGEELLLHELPPDECMAAYSALYKTEDPETGRVSLPKTSQREGGFATFCKFMNDNDINIKTKKNPHTGYVEYVPVLKEKKGKKRKNKKKYSAPVKNFIINNSTHIDSDKGIIGSTIRIHNLKPNEDFGKQHIRNMIEQTREQARFNNPNVELPEIEDDFLSEKEKMQRANLLYLLAFVIYKTNKHKFYIMFSYMQQSYKSSSSCSSSIKKHALLPKYDFIDEAKIFIQLHANAPPPRRSKTKKLFFQLAAIIGVKTNAKQKYNPFEKQQNPNTCRDLET